MSDKSSETASASALKPLSLEEVWRYEDEYWDSNDGDEYVRACKEREKENGVYLEEFEADLTGAGLKDKTIKNHLVNVDFYLNSYLLRDVPHEMRVGCYRLDDFFGYFFIRKCAW